MSAAESTNATVIVTAPARLEICIWDGTVHLTIDDGIHKYELPWAVPDYYDGLAALESNRGYTFTVVEKPFLHGYGGPKVSRIQHADKLVYDRELCEIHHVKMVIKEAPILYGLIGWIPDPNEPSYCTEHHIFPHYRETALGSCEIFSDSPKTRTILICNKCKDAYEEWNKEN